MTLAIIQCTTKILLLDIAYKPLQLFHVVHGEIHYQSVVKPY